MAKRKAPSRAARRARARAHQELVRELERLALAVPGGTPARPLAVVSPAQVEPIAAATPCPLCDGTLHLEEHRAEIVAGVRLRVAAVRCTRCDVPRSLYFRLTGPTIN